MKSSCTSTPVLVLATGAMVLGFLFVEIGVAQEQLGLANPAAVFCGERGGEYQLGTGQCQLRDGRTIDSWEYFRTHHASGSGLPNPAAVFCKENGSYDLNAGTCTLRDGRVVDAWEYFRSRHAK